MGVGSILWFISSEIFSPHLWVSESPIGRLSLLTPKKSDPPTPSANAETDFSQLFGFASSSLSL
jgi:hypothetical protein